LGWAKSWQKKGWKRNKEEAAKNPDLWEKLLKLMNIHQVKLLWVKGHDENVYNQRCDKIAVSESKKNFSFLNKLTFKVLELTQIFFYSTIIFG
jgi:ribonuclease HI